jgi:hypothetical protein
MSDPHVLRRARAPETLAEALAELSASPDPAVRAAVAENPSTPLSTLWSLAPSYPREVLRNPLLELLLLGEPQVFHEAPVKALEALIQRPEAPEGFLFAVATGPHPQLRFWLARSPNLPARLLQHFLLHEEKHLRQSANKNPKRPRDLMKRLLRAGADVSLDHEKRGDQLDPKLPEAELRALFDIDGFFSKWVVLRHPNAPAELFLRAGYEASPLLGQLALAWLTRHPGHPIAQELHHALLVHPDATVKASAARALRLVVEDLRALAEETNPALRRMAAMNPNTPQHVLNALSQDKIPEVRHAVAENRNASAPVLEQLFSRYCASISGLFAWPVASGLAQNPSAPGEILGRIHEMFSFDVSFQQSLAGNPATPPALLLRFAHHHSSRIRARVAGNPGAPREALEHLRSSSLPEIQQALAKNPALSPSPRPPR